MYTYQFDIYKKELVKNCALYPTEVSQRDTPWLYARNNKYAHEGVNPKKVGKWMLFLSQNSVNVIWDKIKAAVANGDLWSSKVSTTNSEKSSYAIMVYTKDYTDKSDVIHVLNYLETSGIKPPRVTIKYKTDEQTRAGIYRGGKQKASIYASNTIRAALAQRSDCLFWRDTQAANQPSCSNSDTPTRGNLFSMWGR